MGVTTHRTTNRLILFSIVIENQSIRLEFLACVFWVHFCFPRMSRAGGRRPGHWVTVAGRRVWEFDDELNRWAGGLRPHAVTPRVSITGAGSFVVDDFVSETGPAVLHVPSWAQQFEDQGHATDVYEDRNAAGWAAEQAVFGPSGVIQQSNTAVGAVMDLGGGILAPQAPGHYQFDLPGFVKEVAGDVLSGAEVGAAVAEAAAEKAWEAYMHEAWNIAAPMLPGDSKEDMLKNALLASLGIAPKFGTKRPDLTEGMTEAEKRAAWDKLHTSGTAAMAGTSSVYAVARKP